MLAVRMEWNIAHEHDIIVAAHFLEGAAQDFLWVLIITGEEFAVGASNAGRRFEQSLAGRVVTCPGDQRAHCGFGFGLAGTKAHRRSTWLEGVYTGVHDMW